MRLSNTFLLFAVGLTQLMGGALAKAEDQRSGIAYVRSGSETLPGYFYKPEGKGPFPAIVMVPSASKPANDMKPPYQEMAKAFTSRGYVVMVPAWHWPIEFVHENAAKNRRMTLPEFQGIARYIAAAVTWSKGQSFVDEERVSVMGHATGGILIMLLAEQEIGVRSYVAFSPAAAIWSDRQDLQKAFVNSVRESKVPIFLIQAQNDFCLGPSEVLGAELAHKGDLSFSKVYPPFGTTREQGNTFAVAGSSVWGDDVFKFLQRSMN
ncbi:MAG: dienelactone hydrolase [Verrucomicrobiales bacterium]|nr:dienelactone hydrolase [Verrucomicrobiales bacterium]